LVVCLVGLGAFSIYVLLAPAQSISLILDIINFTFRFRLELLMIAVINIAACFAFERFAERPIARGISHAKRLLRSRKGRRDRKHAGGHQYKIIEGDMR
jgi:cation-transporting ATPase 13A2